MSFFFFYANLVSLLFPTFSSVPTSENIPINTHFDVNGHFSALGVDNAVSDIHPIFTTPVGLAQPVLQHAAAVVGQSDLPSQANFVATDAVANAGLQGSFMEAPMSMMISGMRSSVNPGAIANNAFPWDGYFPFNHMTTNIPGMTNLGSMNSMNGIITDTGFMTDHGSGLNDFSERLGMDVTGNPAMNTSNMTTLAALGGPSLPQMNVPAPATAPIALPQTTLSTRIPCGYCPQTFARDPDRIRHERSKHFGTPGVYLCPVAACPKSQGQGFSRQDKLTEHKWKQHAALGYTKRV